MWGKIVCSFIILCFIITAAGCGGVPTVPSDSDGDYILIQLTDPESEIIFLAGEGYKDTFAILGEKNNQGEPIKITGTFYLPEQDSGFCYKFREDGLLSIIAYSIGITITFENYTDSSVDIAIYDSNQKIVEGPITVEVDPEDLLEIKQLYTSIHLQKKYLLPGTDFIDFPFIKDFQLKVTNFLEDLSPGVFWGIAVYDEYGNIVDFESQNTWEYEIQITEILEYLIENIEECYNYSLISEIPSLFITTLDEIAKVKQYINLLEAEEEENYFIGYWINEDINTPGITKIDIQENNDLLEIHMWGKCHPTDCDWGIETTPVDDADDGVLNIFWYPDFAIRTQEIIYLGGDRLEVYTFTDFYPDDIYGREDYERYDYFIKSD